MKQIKARVHEFWNMCRQKQKIREEITRNRRECESRKLSANPMVSIIMLNRNGKQHLERLMSSMEKEEFYSNFEIIMVDNASSDDSAAYMKGLKDKFDITVIQNTENKSFSEANNDGAAAARGKYLLFLNNDTQVTEGWLDALLDTALTKENVGAAGAKLVYPKIPDHCLNAGKSYTIQHRGIAFRGIKRNGTYFVQPYNMGNGDKNLGADSEPEERACVTAAVMLVPKKAFDAVGGFDERYQYGYEDVDLCLKLYKAGFRNYYCPGALVFHYEFGTQEKDDDQQVKDRRLQNMRVFQEKWQTYLQQRILDDKIHNRRIFTETGLVAAIVPEKFEQPGEAEGDIGYKKIKASLEKAGCTVKFPKGFKKNKPYEIGYDVDVLISLADGYDFSMLKSVKTNLIKIPWLEEKEMTWERLLEIIEQSCI